MTEQELYQQYLKETGQGQSEDALYQQYLKETGQGGAEISEPVEPEIQDIQHPELGWWDRTKIKNFSNSNDAAMKYLQKQGFETKADEQGEILLRKSGEKNWMKVDPSSMEFSDITDSAWDLGQGVAETGAAAAGGVGGAALGLTTGPGAIVASPALALTGAAGAGAAAATTLDATRQGIGNLFGVGEGLDTESLKTNAMFGAASPLLFGTGAASKNILKQGSKMGLSQADQLLLKNSQQGVASRLYSGAKEIPYVGAPAKYIEKIPSKVGSMMSGIDQKYLSQAREKLSDIEGFEKSGNVTQEAETIADSIMQPVAQKLDDIGTQIGKATDEMGVTFNVDLVNKPLLDMKEVYAMKMAKYVEKYGEEGAAKKADFKEMSSALEKIESYIQTGELKGKEAIDYKRSLNDLTVVTQGEKKGLSSIEKDLMRRATEVASNLDKQIKGSTEGLGDLYSQYSKALDDQKYLKDKFYKAGKFDAEKAEGTIRSFASKSKATRADRVKKIADSYGAGKEFREGVDNEMIYRLFANPSDELASMGQSTSGRSIPLSVGGGLAGYGIGQSTGGEYSPFFLGALGAGAGRKLGSPKAMMSFMKADKYLREQPMNALGNASQNYIGQNPLNAGVNVYQQLLQSMEQEKGK